MRVVSQEGLGTRRASPPPQQIPWGGQGEGGLPGAYFKKLNGYFSIWDIVQMAIYPFGK